MEGGPPIFSQGFSCPDLLESSVVRFRIRGFHPLRRCIPTASANTLQTLGLLPVRSPLLGESRLISFPQGTEMFHFPWFAPLKGNMTRAMLGCPIQKSGNQSFLAAPPGLSQPSTSFIASLCLGIHHLPLVSFRNLRYYLIKCN